MNEFELSDQILDYMKSHSLESEQKGWGFRFKVHVRENAEVAFALTTNPTRMDGNYVAYNTGGGYSKPFSLRPQTQDRE